MEKLYIKILFILSYSLLILLRILALPNGYFIFLTSFLCKILSEILLKNQSKLLPQDAFYALYCWLKEFCRSRTHDLLLWQPGYFNLISTYLSKHFITLSLITLSVFLTLREVYWTVVPVVNLKSFHKMRTALDTFQT